MLEDTGGALGKKVEESTEEKKEEVDDKKERSRSKEKSGRKHKEKKGGREILNCCGGGESYLGHSVCGGEVSFKSRLFRPKLCFNQLVSRNCWLPPPRNL